MSSSSLWSPQPASVQVLVVLKDGRLAYQRVFMFSHRDASMTSEFVTLHTASGARIQMSPSHYVWGAQALALRHSQRSGASTPWRSRKAAIKGGQDRQRSVMVEATRKRDYDEPESSTGAAQDSVTVSRRQLLDTSRLWLETFGDSQVTAITSTNNEKGGTSSSHRQESCAPDMSPTPIQSIKVSHKRSGSGHQYPTSQCAPFIHRELTPTHPNTGPFMLHTSGDLV